MFSDVSREWADVHGRVWDDSDAQGREFTLSLGNQILPLEEAENQRWRQAVQPILDDYIKDAKSKNLPGDEYVATLRQLIDEFSAR